MSTRVALLRLPVTTVFVHVDENYLVLSRIKMIYIDDTSIEATIPK